ncbi:hypothetical protein BC827DRAFT_1263195 [Russula dissimulans]|nr:hypothetical protein BC827DRAFT_1263195 [Russula dissimulans]
MTPGELSTVQPPLVLTSDTATGTIALNNYLQAKGKLAALSWYDTSSGPAHEPEWTSDCKIDGEVIASGKGTHKHLARDAAADKALAILMSEDS